MSDLITIYKSQGWWVADMSKTADTEEIIQLLDTPVLSTAYTTAIPAKTVQVLMLARNPRALVVIRE